MQNTRTNELELALSLAALRESIPEEDQGPTFEDGEIIRIKGYYYRVVGLETDRLTFEPYGRTKAGRDAQHLIDIEQELAGRSPRRPGQHD